MIKKPCASPEIEGNGLCPTLFVARGDCGKLRAPRFADVVELFHGLAGQRVQDALVKVEGAVFVPHEQFPRAMAGELVKGNLIWSRSALLRGVPKPQVLQVAQCTSLVKSFLIIRYIFGRSSKKMIFVAT